MHRRLASLGFRNTSCTGFEPGVGIGKQATAASAQLRSTMTTSTTDRGVGFQAALGMFEHDPCFWAVLVRD